MWTSAKYLMISSFLSSNCMQCVLSFLTLLKLAKDLGTLYKLSTKQIFVPLFFEIFHLNFINFCFDLYKFLSYIKFRFGFLLFFKILMWIVSLFIWNCVVLMWGFASANFPLQTVYFITQFLYYHTGIISWL